MASKLTIRRCQMERLSYGVAQMLQDRRPNGMELIFSEGFSLDQVGMPHARIQWNPSNMRIS